MLIRTLFVIGLMSIATASPTAAAWPVTSQATGTWTGHGSGTTEGVASPAGPGTYWGRVIVTAYPPCGGLHCQWHVCTGNGQEEDSLGLQPVPVSAQCTGAAQANVDPSADLLFCPVHEVLKDGIAIERGAGTCTLLPGSGGGH